MKKIELPIPNVVLEEETHTYSDMQGKSYQGITGMIKNQLFPDKYQDVPEDIMMRAAKRGSDIHAMCEMYVNFGLECNEIVPYMAAIEREKLTPERAEYVVNNDYFATPIDVIFRTDENTFTLADIKTTATLDKEYVSWQLSICEYLLHNVAPEVNVDKYLAIHFRDGKCKVVEVDKKPQEEVEKLLKAERNSQLYELPAEMQESTTLPAEFTKIQEHLAETLLQKKKYESEEKELKAKLLEAMEKYNVKKWENDLFTATRKDETEVQRFDAKRYQEEHPEEYQEYIKVSKMKSSLLIKLK